MFHLFYISEEENIASLNFDTYKSVVFKENSERSSIEIFIDNINVYDIKKSYIVENLESILLKEDLLLEYYSFIISKEVFKAVEKIKLLGFSNIKDLIKDKKYKADIVFENILLVGAFYFTCIVSKAKSKNLTWFKLSNQINDELIVLSLFYLIGSAIDEI